MYKISANASMFLKEIECIILYFYLIRILKNSPQRSRPFSQRNSTSLSFQYIWSEKAGLRNKAPPLENFFHNLTSVRRCELFVPQ